MRIMPLLQAACLSLMLSACVAPLLLMSPTSQLMWALLKPLVGFDPNEVNLFEQPLIKDRMTAMLGPNYDSTMQLLKTADELQQEGPLFYLVSRYAPVPEIARQAGMVWNADTNQLAVMLQKGDGATQVFGENLTAAAPAWPGAMQEWQSVSPAATALGGVNQAITNSNEALLGSLMGAVQQSATQAIVNTAQQAVDGATGAAVQPLGKGETAATQATQGVTGDLQQANQAVTDAARQTVSGTGVSAPQQASRAVAEAVTEPVEQAAASAAASPQRQAGKAVVDTARQAVSGATTTAQQASKAEEKGSTLSDQARADAEAELEKLLN